MAVKQVFPTLDVVGWYSVGEEPDADDFALHTQVSVGHNLSRPSVSRLSSLAATARYSLNKQG